MEISTEASTTDQQSKGRSPEEQAVIRWMNTLAPAFRLAMETHVRTPIPDADNEVRRAAENCIYRCLDALNRFEDTL